MGEKGCGVEGLISFDQAKLAIVGIDDVYPNSWNPKEEDTEELAKVVKSIASNGMRMPVIVREREVGYEIIDGQQRWTACKRLGFTQVPIYNEGQIDDKLAQELTIWYQVQVPFSRIDEAFLVQGLVDTYADVNLPYTESELSMIEKLVKYEMNFDANAYERPEGEAASISVTVLCDTEDQADELRHRLVGEGFKIK